MSLCEPPEGLDGEPPSVLLVYRVLRDEGALTQDQIVAESYAHKRTVRYALSRLDELGLLKTRADPSDARKRVYRLEPES